MVLKAARTAAAAATAPKKEKYSDWSSEDTSSFSASLSYLIVFVFVLLLVILIGQWLWNASVVPLLPVKQAKSVWPILGLFIFTHMLLNF